MLQLGLVLARHLGLGVEQVFELDVLLPGLLVGRVPCVAELRGSDAEMHQNGRGVLPLKEFRAVKLIDSEGAGFLWE